MSRNIPNNWIFGVLAALLILGSWVFFLHLWNDTYWNDERYTLVAVDRLSRMNLSFNEGEYFSQLVGPTIFAVGSNANYLVLKQHPLDEKTGTPDRTVTNFYLLVRTNSSELDDQLKAVRGPLTRAEFEKLDATLSLPKFSKSFPELE
jgi:hypothetical protein